MTDTTYTTAHLTKKQQVDAFTLNGEALSVFLKTLSDAALDHLERDAKVLAANIRTGARRYRITHSHVITADRCDALKKAVHVVMNDRAMA